MSTAGQFERIEDKVEYYLQNIEKRDKVIKAFIEVFSEEALETARKLDLKAKNQKGNKNLGLLFGKVFAIKNNICIKGKRITCSSKMLENYKAPYNATVINDIIREGGIIIGSTNMDEFACGSDCSYSAFFPTRNPIDTELVPGGSSGGSGAAVAAEFCDYALGSDTGGSVRCPAAFCGIYGMKPSYGTVSRYGLVDMAMSLDQIGPLARDLDSLENVMKVIAHPDPNDDMCRHRIDYRTVKKPRFAVVKEFIESIDPEIKERTEEIIQELKKYYDVSIVSIPILKYGISIYYLCMCAELSSALQKFDGLKYGLRADIRKDLEIAVSEVRGIGFGKEIKRRIIVGTYITMSENRDAWYARSLAARKTIREEFEKIFKLFDAVIGPTVPIFPWKLGEKISPIHMYQTDVLTVSANLAGIPAISVPIKGLKLPAGIQVHAGFLKEGVMFQCARIIKEIADRH